jgi:hypothetical protein
VWQSPKDAQTVYDAQLRKGAVATPLHLQCAPDDSTRWAEAHVPPISVHTRSCILALKVTSRCTSKERDFGLDAEAPALSDESFPARQELTITAERRTRASQHLLSSYDVVLVA